MFVLILLLVFGSGVAYFALQNTSLVTLTLANYTFVDVPLFHVMIGSMLVGVVLAYVIHLVYSISTSMTIYGKDKKIKHAENELTELTKKVHQLELENTELRAETNLPDIDEKSL